jgi:uncharacterized membrane protein YhaH (DUF805 family)
MHYLFGFNGRINRAKMWLFLIVTLVWEIVIALVGAAGLGWTRWHSYSIEVLPWPDPVSGWQWLAVAAVLALFAAYAVALLAVTLKRLHDRGKNALWLILFIFIPVGLSYLEDIGVPGAINLVRPFGPFGISWDTADLIATVLSIWGFIELFCLRGTQGPNPYGPDPLA